jgi:hypothetical protein
MAFGSTRLARSPGSFADNILQSVVLHLRLRLRISFSFLLHLALALIGWKTLSGSDGFRSSFSFPLSQHCWHFFSAEYFAEGWIENAYFVLLSTHWSGSAGYCAERWIMRMGFSLQR